MSVSLRKTTTPGCFVYDILFQNFIAKLELSVWKVLIKTASRLFAGLSTVIREDISTGFIFIRIYLEPATLNTKP